MGKENEPVTEEQRQKKGAQLLRMMGLAIINGWTISAGIFAFIEASKQSHPELSFLAIGLIFLGLRNAVKDLSNKA